MRPLFFCLTFPVRRTLSDTRDLKINCHPWTVVTALLWSEMGQKARVWSENGRLGAHRRLAHHFLTILKEEISLQCWQKLRFLESAIAACGVVSQPMVRINQNVQESVLTMSELLEVNSNILCPWGLKTPYRALTFINRGGSFPP